VSRRWPGPGRRALAGTAVALAVTLAFALASPAPAGADTTTTTVPDTTTTVAPTTTTTVAPTTTTSTTLPPTTTTTTRPERSTTTTTTPTTTTVPSATAPSSTPWGLIVLIIVLVAAIVLVAVLLASRRRKSEEAGWRQAVVPALSDAQLARDSLLSGNALSDDPQMRGAVDAQVGRAAAALDRASSRAPDDAAGALAAGAAGSLRGLAFAIEADRILRHGSVAPTGAQLAQADEARRARASELGTALARLSTRVSAGGAKRR
jgi:hypothetical protein